MATYDMNDTQGTTQHSGKGPKTAILVLAAGLAVALAGDAYLISKSNHLTADLASTQSASQIQISKLNEATGSLLEQQKQRLDQMADQMKKEVKGASDSASGAIRRVRMDAEKEARIHDEDLATKLLEQRKQITTEMSQIQDTTNSKFTDVATNVDGVKANVEAVKASVASAQGDIDKNIADLKRAMGDMGVMSGLIATNAKDLEALRMLGERNYFEFDIAKKDAAKKVGDVTLTLKKSDTKRNRFTLDVLADDRHVEKKDKTINEPVQLYVSGNAQPYEIVVNHVTKDRVTGYLATPKVKLARR